MLSKLVFDFADVSYANFEPPFISATEVVQVIYPGFHKDSENVNRVKKYFEKGNGPLVGFELKGGQESGQQYHIRDAMNDVANTVEYLIENEGYDGEIEDNGRRELNDKSST